MLSNVFAKIIVDLRGLRGPPQTYMDLHEPLWAPTEALCGCNGGRGGPVE